MIGSETASLSLPLSLSWTVLVQRATVFDRGGHQYQAIGGGEKPEGRRYDEQTENYNESGKYVSLLSLRVGLAYHILTYIDLTTTISTIIDMRSVVWIQQTKYMPEFSKHSAMKTESRFSDY